jgi:excisionase family DNA binding protein
MLTRRFLTVKEVADLMHVSEASVRHWIKLRQLRAIDLGREWRVIPRDLETFLAKHETCHAASTPADAGSAALLIPDTSSGAPSVPLNGMSQPTGARRGHSSAAATRGTSRSKETPDAGA